jgi:hypothetical protein
MESPACVKPCLKKVIPRWGKGAIQFATSNNKNGVKLIQLGLKLIQLGPWSDVYSSMHIHKTKTKSVPCVVVVQPYLTSNSNEQHTLHTTGFQSCQHLHAQ